MFSGLRLRDLHETFADKENNLIFEKNVDIPGIDELPIRANLYIPQAPKDTKFPVLVTYGPYGKDVHLSEFNARSWEELNPEHKTKYSSWETPEPVFWTRHGYAVVRADERGLGQSPGKINLSSAETAQSFAKVIEWAGTQPWSSGKVGTIGISYYAATQWAVAALQPKHLSAMIPWEGYSDAYRDNSRHGGIKSSSFFPMWWKRQIAVNQYGKPNKAATDWGDDTKEGTLSEEVLRANVMASHVDSVFADDLIFRANHFLVDNIQTPLLSVGNWGGNALHLRGNVEGFTWAGSKFKYLRLISGRHDLPFYEHDQVEVQRSFLDAFLKGEDREGWSVPGRLPPVSLTIRKGDVGFNDPAGEATFERRVENSWPIKRTQYTKYFLGPDGTLGTTPTPMGEKLSYKALASLDEQSLIQFTSAPLETETEITGHIVVHLNISLSADFPSERNDIDVFVTLRHISVQGVEVLYTGTVGDPTPIVKGWLRTSLRKVDETHLRHRSYLPRRNYLKKDVQPVVSGEIYALDVELWPTCTVIEAGGKLIVEISSGDTQGVGIFQHSDKVDRPKDAFAGINHLHFSEGQENYIILPIIQSKSR